MTDGAINVERCASHVYVEWTSNIDVLKWDNEQKSVSPTFEIENQSYSLRTHVDMRSGYFKFSLTRVGPPVGRSLSWWAGLKYPNGNYDRGQSIGILCPRDECLKLLEWIDNHYYSMFYGWSHEPFNFTLCFKVQVEEQSGGMETFTHGFAEKMLPPSDGQIYQKECNCLKHVEWTLDFDWDEGSCWMSSAFEIGNQLFRFVFSWDSGNDLVLKLYWLGPSADDPGISVRCLAGLKRCDGTYHHKNETHEFFLEDRAWKRQLGLVHVTSQEISDHHLDGNKRLTFFLRISEETEAEPCNFDRPEEFPRGVGSIQKEILSPHVLVQWTFTIDKISEVSSPVFVADNQNYVLSFERQPDEIHTKCSLSRKGPFADRDVRYLCAVRRSHDLYEDLGCQRGQLDLRKTADLWFFEVRLYEVWMTEMYKEFTVDLLLTCEESPFAGALCFSDLSQSEEDFINSPEMDPSFVVFKVGDTALKVHKAPLLVCVPAFKSMLTKEWLENKTGIVTIEDCEAVAFKEFLELAEFGFGRQPSAENALALYGVANKYLLPKFKFDCFEIIRENLSVDNICDVLELGIVYEDQYLLHVASHFLSRNSDIMESVSFNDCVLSIPDAINELKRRVSRLHERDLNPFE